MKKVTASICILILIFSSSISYSQITLPRLINDGIVLQHGIPVSIWGWASPNENISLEFRDSNYITQANINGEWLISLPSQNIGGPHEMTFKGKNTITVKDILFGDVWLCSGQSNMELPLARVNVRYNELLSNVSNDEIRYFDVTDKYDFNVPQKDVAGGRWIKANQDNILEFSAVAYFFASHLYEEYEVPIGLINASLGGSPIQAWMSESTLKNFPKDYNELKAYQDTEFVAKIIHDDKARINNWHNELRTKDLGYKLAPYWNSSLLNTDQWDTMSVPGYWKDSKLGQINGVVWFRKEITLEEDGVGNLSSLLILGRIVDADSVFINDTFVGTTGYQYPPRRYNIPKNTLKKGKNIITVRVVNQIGNGGFVFDKEYMLHYGDKKLDLKGDWKYALGVKMPPLQSETFVRWKPAGLFNGMINPLLNYKIKGAIWYQGESNAWDYKNYTAMLNTMIADWRTQWGIGDFPFIFVQLPNFMKANNKPEDTDWARFREAQTKSLYTSNTGMAVAIDIGEWNDIHPLNKDDVGKRLAYNAMKLAYKNDSIIFSGPQYQSFTIVKDSIIISFSNKGSGLMIKDSNQLKQFSIAGQDGIFYWANATIKNNEVIVWNVAVHEPKAVRYAWSNNPSNANLYNKEGLPSSPFRTDNYLR